MSDQSQGIDSLIHSISSDLSPEDVAKTQETANRVKEQNASQEMLRFKMFAADSSDRS